MVWVMVRFRYCVGLWCRSQYDSWCPGSRAVLAVLLLCSCSDGYFICVVNSCTTHSLNIKKSFQQVEALYSFFGGSDDGEAFSAMRTSRS